MKSAGPVTFRLKLPPKAKIAVHTHPLVEHVTVLSGTFYFATGDAFDAKAKAYPVGSTLVIPAGMPMFAFTKDKESTIQAHGIGPWGIDYSNPADAPAKKKQEISDGCICSKKFCLASCIAGRLARGAPGNPRLAQNQASLSENWIPIDLRVIG